MTQEQVIARRRLRRRFRVRRRIRGTTERPRLSVFRSNKHMQVQVIDDDRGRTLAAASTYEKEILGSLRTGGNKLAAQAVGKAIAERALAAGVKHVCFDRREYRYHGRVAALADAARAGGLGF